MTIFFLSSLHAQKARSIDNAAGAAVTYLEGRIPDKTKVVILNVASDYPDLSNYVIGSLFTGFVNSGKFTVVDRAHLESIRQELHFQLSGEVSDTTAQRVGHLLGAESIVSGSIVPVGKNYRLQVRAIAVESALVQGAENYPVKRDALVRALTGGSLFAEVKPAATRLYVDMDDEWKYKRIFFRPPNRLFQSRLRHRG